jgi:Tol biopolymer transport system component
MSLHSDEHSGKKLFNYDLATTELTLLPQQPMNQINSHGVWSPDGKQVLFSSRRLPEPMLWRP